MEKFCLECGEKLIIKTKRDLTRKKFCSKSCNGSYYAKKRFANNPDWASKFIENCSKPEINAKKGRKGEKHHLWKGGPVQKICQKCGNFFSISAYRDGEGYGKFCSMACYLKDHVKPRIKVNCLQCNKEVELREKRLARFKFCSSSCRAIYNRSRSHKRVTWIESKVEIMLKELDIFYQHEKDVGNFVVADFLLPNKICIFCDGEYWHTRNKDKNRDQIVNAKLSDLGYKVLRFTDKEIHSNYEDIKFKIISCFNKHI